MARLTRTVKGHTVLGACQDDREAEDDLLFPLDIAQQHKRELEEAMQQPHIPQRVKDTWLPYRIVYVEIETTVNVTTIEGA